MWKKGHPVLHCLNSDAEDDNKSLTSTQESIKKLQKDLKKVQKAFSTVNTQLQQLKEEASDISDEDTAEEDSHFQINMGFQFTQIKNNQFKPCIMSLFKQVHPMKVKLDLKHVILLDSQSTIDLMCNPAYVGKVRESKSSMQLKSNGGSLLVMCKANVPGYHKSVWFSK
jgi:superfamily I DNA and/or RNA helicase